MRPMIILALLVGCQSSPGDSTGSGECACVWEGPVEYRLEQAWSDDDAVYAAVHLDFVPCCEESHSSDLMIRVSPDSGTVQEVSDVSAGAVELSAGEPVCASIDFPELDRRAELACSATDSVTADELQIGALIDTTDETAVALMLTL